MGNSFLEKGLLKVSDDFGGFFIQCLLKKYFAYEKINIFKGGSLQ
jgi:hypothetical protein